MASTKDLNTVSQQVFEPSIQTANAGMNTASAPFFWLPNELLTEIINKFGNNRKDLLAIRLVCHRFHNSSWPAFDETISIFPVFDIRSTLSMAGLVEMSQIEPLLPYIKSLQFACGDIAEWLNSLKTSDHAQNIQYQQGDDSHHFSTVRRVLEGIPSKLDEGGAGILKMFNKQRRATSLTYTDNWTWTINLVKPVSGYRTKSSDHVEDRKEQVIDHCESNHDIRFAQQASGINSFIGTFSKTLGRMRNLAGIQYHGLTYPAMCRDGATMMMLKEVSEYLDPHSIMAAELEVFGMKVLFDALSKANLDLKDVSTTSPLVCPNFLGIPVPVQVLNKSLRQVEKLNITTASSRRPFHIDPLGMLDLEESNICVFSEKNFPALTTLNIRINYHEEDEFHGGREGWENIPLSHLLMIETFRNGPHGSVFDPAPAITTFVLETNVPFDIQLGAFLLRIRRTLQHLKFQNCLLGPWERLVTECLDKLDLESLTIFVDDKYMSDSDVVDLDIPVSLLDCPIGKLDLGGEIFREWLEGGWEEILGGENSEDQDRRIKTQTMGT